MALQWSDNLLTGFTHIDDAHRNIFEAANRVLAHDKQALNFIDLFDDIDHFRSQVTEHFQSEESLMTQHRYPTDQQQAHALAHRKILTQMNDVLNKSSTFDQMLDLIHYLMGQWIPKHTAEHDRLLVHALVNC